MSKFVIDNYFEKINTNNKQEKTHIEVLSEFLKTKVFNGDDFDVEVKKIKDAGMPIVTDVKESASGIKTFFFKDPEGNVIHFIYRPVAL